VELSTI